ncbi:MAG: type II toxin-antitoxin system RelE/ParE family toxin [Saprospiraceae bacterium]|nr:type II toxin-antitoxin system RelE/ParE family toxin [Saprospiraceae bacterium]MCF8252398.1 type II toxin-antitoxin system RelE/ParE family toxin [Saprospiraceae bacterium]MCF8282268.1 type II toxin-antitoxin system RelE/ParE family toxin [Bacteroidales bacterium]MCF8313978.1 type II toxin-antitoxin system RelE/ParE family toxin [Saprospiraceae bacterium]MCF8442728.1 type II toxin-antitoxin system RelE/ParE family toxin [Saprospiraceae bacterium]
MAYNIELHEIAEEELWEAVDWYDAQKEKLGRDFAKELQEVVKLLKDNPQQFPKAFKDKRKAVLRHFPYVVIYEIQGDTVYVLAIFHTSRNPKIWRERV